METKINTYGFIASSLVMLGIFQGCSGDSGAGEVLYHKEDVRYQENESDDSQAVVGAYPLPSLETNLGTIILPDSVVEHLRKNDIVPNENTLIAKICTEIGHRPHLAVANASDNAMQSVINMIRQDQESALIFLWLIYASERETVMTKLSAVGGLTPQSVDIILALNLHDVLLRAFDQQYTSRISQIVNYSVTSVQQHNGENLANRLIQIRQEQEKMAAQICISRGLQNAQRNQAVMDAAIGELNNLRARSKQRRDNFWSWRERKLESTTPTNYGGSSMCSHCGGLTTVGGRCPASPDGRHHINGTGPIMIDAAHEGIMAW